MRGTSSQLHSRAEQVLRLLVHNSILGNGIGVKFAQHKLFLLPIDASSSWIAFAEVHLAGIVLLDGLHLADNVSVISIVSVQWAPVFKLRKSSLLTFIQQLLLKDPRIVHAYRQNIISAFIDIIKTSEEEVILLLLIFCERMQVQVQSPGFLDGASGEQVSRICIHLDAIGYWIEIIYEILHGDSSVTQLQESKLALM